jgi:uncharacterized membrane protein YkoI
MNILVRSVCAALIVLASPAWADVSRDDAAAVAQRLSSGRVLSVEKSESAGRPVWRVKVLTAQGEVRVILIDVASGKPL